ncbi:YobI family P-loop NTPase [Elizabethkingia anophelis]|uniref:YobI family P-loop NTPase n=1 Tax=Elizabethkingia anophelis TaxID=1117645 RepID=UPI0008409003|nr:hypothetical protein [Elizabethkingia anophelis]OCW74127.1 hypothetical protein A4G24_03160 [Elizabethkingia anophelis]
MINNDNPNIISNTNQTDANTQASDKDSQTGTKLEILSPLNKKDDPRIQKYVIHLKNAIDNQEVKNLALSGVYGSGKSTIIKSFKSTFPNVKALDISLASFRDNNEYEKFKDQIQLTILQQIIYSQKADKLPDSRINRISEINIWDYKHWIKVISILTLVISSYLLINFYKYQLNINNWYFSNSIKDFILYDFSYSYYYLIICFLISFFVIGQVLIKQLINSKLSKVSTKLEAEISNGNTNKDFLNKHIDELLYFFEKIPTDIVIIEDLDRFNTTEIYRTLREVNFILNNYIKNLNLENYKKITFLYAIKDDLFSSELDRTKFFDLIIPAIPFVNYSNSKNVLNNRLNEIFNNEKAVGKPNKQFINTVSTFITDNRTLLNIINEFIIFREQQKLQVEELNSEKLLALIIYKNLRPKDFSRLHNCKSSVDIIFGNKHNIILDSINDLDKKIESIEEEIRTIKKDNLKTIKDLNTIFIFHIKEKTNNINAKGLIFGSELKTFKQIIDNALDLTIFYNQPLEWYVSSVYQYTLSERMEEIDKVVGYSYSDKYYTLMNNDKIIFEKENDIKQLRNEQTEVNNWTLEQILKKKNFLEKDFKNQLDSFYSKSIIKEDERAYNDPLLIFLLVNGHIDEHYREYTSIFQKGGLNEMDHEFKINIISTIHEPKSIDYELNDIDDIINELPINYFQNDRILNIQLLDFLIVNRIIYKEKLQAIFKTISEWDSKRTKKFLSTYLYKGNQKNEVIIELAKYWNSLWTVTKSDLNFIEDDKKQILYILLNNADNNILTSLNENKELSNYISDNIDVLYEFRTYEQLKRIQEVLSDKVLNIKFKELTVLPENLKELFTLVYENNRYELNKNNIGTFIENKFDLHFDLDSFDKTNLSYIYDSELHKLINYLEEDNFESYIGNVYPELENQQQDEEEYLLKVLNNEKLSIEKKSIFIEKQIGQISDINELKYASCYDLVIEKFKIKSTWENVYQYYIGKDNIFVESIISYLNHQDSYNNLIKYKINLFIDDDEAEKEFILKLISNNKLSNASYEAIITKCIPDYFKIPEDFDFNIIDQYKIKELINLKIIPLTETTFERLKSTHTNLHIDLLLRDWNEYLAFHQTYNIDTEDKIKILQSDKLNDYQKLNIIKTQILVNDLEDENLSYEVTNIILNNSSHSIGSKGLFNLAMLKAILSNNLITDEQKIRLVNLFNEQISKSDLLEIQKLIPKTYQVYPKSQLMLKENDTNWKYVDLLKYLKIAGEAKITKKGEIRVWLLDYTK